MMRISTVTMFEQGTASMNRQQREFMEVSEQIASGRRVVRPSDDPQAASRAVQVDQSLAVTEQHEATRVGARNALAQEESVLNSVSDGVTRAKTLLVQAASDTLGDADRESVASELRGVREALLGQANATDGNGRYLFGGYQDSSEPFVRAADGSIDYVGDANVREERVDASRLMPVGDSGEAVFRSVADSAGYLAEADAGNAGTVTFEGPAIVDPADPDFGNAFDIEFSVTAGGTTYSVNGGPDQTYRPGDPVRFGGLSLTLDGAPADGDRIAVDRAQNMDPDLFATLDSAIAALEQPAGTDAEKAARKNTLNTAMRELDNSLDNVLTVRASVGARLNELDVVDSVAGNRRINYERTLSDLVDLDYVKGVSDYRLRQVGLQAAQQAFADIRGLSLFDRL